MKPTIEQLEQIQNERIAEANRIQLALTLRVCPECGADLIVQTLGMTFLTSKLYDVCSANEPHFKEEKYIGRRR